MTEVLEENLTSSLRNRTKSTHGRLDEKIMGLGLFSNQELYKKFVALQYYIHNHASALYENSDLAKIIPNLKTRNRFDKVKADMKDLNIQPPSIPSPTKTQNISEAIGVLYVVEGSKLGAKYLSTHVEKLGLSDTYGARHLGADEEGRGASWRSFQTAIDSANIDVAVAVKSAENTFNRVFDYLQIVTA